MDYTTVDLVKQALGGTEDSDDPSIQDYVTRASRFIDRYTAQSLSAENYYLLENVSNETISGQVDVEGHLVCWPHKPLVASVSALAYRMNPMHSWVDADVSRVTTEGGKVKLWNGSLLRVRMMVKISYSGGMAAETESLPADLIEAATILAIRFYKEAKTGLTDSIGVAELGTLVYTKALPVRLVEMLKPYKRVAQW